MNTKYLKYLFHLRAHIGAKSQQSSEFSFLYGTKHKQSIFDLQKTLKYLIKACFFLFQAYPLVQNKVLFVSTHPKLDHLAKKTALAVDESYVTEKWTSGTLTNWRETNKAYFFQKKINFQEEKEQSFGKQKKVQNMLKKRFVGLKSSFRPKLLIVLNPKSNSILLHEAKILHIPVISFVEGDFPSSLIPYPIPCNIRSYSFMVFCMNLFIKIIKKAQK
jgi:ribosomal protein S2